MDTFGIAHRVVAEDPEAPNHVYNGSCRLMAVFCSSVGLTGLPVDPPPPAVIATLVPVSGPDNTPITITGSGFGTEIGECKIGGEFVIVQTWADTVITALASQGDKPSGEALTLSVARAGGEPVELADAFTFAAVADPVIASVTPANGPQNAIVVIAGTGFGAAQGTVAFGLDEMIVQAWADTEITVMTVQFNSNQGEPLDVVVTRPDAKSATTVGGYTHDVTAGTLSAKGKKAEAAKIEALRAEAEATAKKAAKKGKARKSITTVAVDTHSTEVTMPEFASGAGIMLRDASGNHILVGPFELEAGRLYPMPIECPDGLEVVPSGVFDITLMLARPL